MKIVRFDFVSQYIADIIILWHFWHIASSYADKPLILFFTIDIKFRKHKQNKK